MFVIPVRNLLLGVIGLLIFCAGCGPKKPPPMVVAAPPGTKPLSTPPEITSETEEGFADLVFLLEERKDLENGQQLITATGFHERQGLAFEIVLGKSWSGSGGDSSAPPMRVGIVSIRRHRELSDLLLQVMSQLYATKAKPTRMRDEVRFSGISLLGDPAHLEQGPANIKLFHESDKEDEYVEFFLNIDTKARRVEIREKDPEYREAVVRALSDPGKGTKPKTKP